MPPITPPTIAPVAFANDEEEDEEELEVEGVFRTTVTVGEDKVTPGYDVCRAIVS